MTSSSLPPGVVTGERCRTLVASAQEGGYALVAVNATSSSDKLTSLGHFSVTASFGNVHGVYKPGNVKLRPKILKNSQALVEEKKGTDQDPLNLVFHSGSGSEKAKIREAVGDGVFKMNIDTDDGTPYKKYYDPRKWVRTCEESMAERLVEAFEDLGSKSRSIAQANS